MCVCEFVCASKIPLLKTIKTSTAVAVEVHGNDDDDDDHQIRDASNQEKGV